MRNNPLRFTEFLSILEDHSSEDSRRLMVDSTLMGLA